MSIQLSMNEATSLAATLGAHPTTLRVWKHRQSVPSKWQTKILEHLDSGLSISGTKSQRSLAGTLKKRFF